MLNFGRWLGRLGYKTTEQPAVVMSAQPVVVVGSQDMLTPAMLGPSYLVGCDYTAAVAAFTAIQFVGPAAAWIDLAFTTGGIAGQVAFEIGQSGTAPPVLGGAVATLVKQSFRVPGQELRVQRGDLAAAPSIDLPQVRIASNQTHPVIHRVYKPEGGWLSCGRRDANSSLIVWARVFELPNELPQ